MPENSFRDKYTRCEIIETGNDSYWFKNRSLPAFCPRAAVRLPYGVTDERELRSDRHETAPVGGRAFPPKQGIVEKRALINS